MKELQARNEKKRRKMEVLRKSKEDTESQLRKNYRSLQDTVLHTILEQKDKAMSRLKERIFPAKPMRRAESSGSLTSPEKSRSVSPESEYPRAVIKV